MVWLPPALPGRLGSVWSSSGENSTLIFFFILGQGFGHAEALAQNKGRVAF